MRVWKAGVGCCVKLAGRGMLHQEAHVGAGLREMEEVSLEGPAGESQDRG